MRRNPASPPQSAELVPKEVLIVAIDAGHGGEPLRDHARAVLVARVEPRRAVAGLNLGGAVVDGAAKGPPGVVPVAVVAQYPQRVSAEPCVLAQVEVLGDRAKPRP